MKNDVEDIHSQIELLLTQSLGDVGKKIHSARSRNDQVATAFRLWLREKIAEISRLARGLQKSLVDLAEQNRSAVLPGYTHLQRAQPISAGAEAAAVGEGAEHQHAGRTRRRGTMCE